MQSLQADQSLYNRKGVCYIVHVIGRFQDLRTVLRFVMAKIINFLEKHNNIIDDNWFLTLFRLKHFNHHHIL